jgi:hypothetical protein
MVQEARSRRMENRMTTQRQRIRAKAISAERAAQAAMSIGAAENEGMPVSAPARTTEPELRLAPVVATHASERFRPLPVQAPLVNALRRVGSFRAGSKWGPLR